MVRLISSSAAEEPLGVAQLHPLRSARPASRRWAGSPSAWRPGSPRRRRSRAGSRSERGCRDRTGTARARAIEMEPVVILVQLHPRRGRAVPLAHHLVGGRRLIARREARPNRAASGRFPSAPPTGGSRPRGRRRCAMRNRSGQPTTASPRPQPWRQAPAWHVGVQQRSAAQHVVAIAAQARRAGACSAISRISGSSFAAACTTDAAGFVEQAAAAHASTRRRSNWILV